LLDSAPEERFDRITRIARRLFQVDVVLVSLVDAERQWFKSAQGLDAVETARDISFCGHAILHTQPLIIEDARLDLRFCDNPLVTGPPWLRFYAGVPLRGPGGYLVGTLCLIDPSPRSMSGEDLSALQALAAMVETEINSAQLSAAVVHAKSNAARLSAILQNAVDGIIVLDQQGHINTANPAVAHMFGWQESELPGKEIGQLIAGFQAGDAAHSGTQWHEARGRRSSGASFPLELAVSELKLDRGRTWSLMLRDVSVHKRAADELRAVNRELAHTTGMQQAILNSANFSIIATDVDGIIQTFSAGAQRMLGYTAAELVGKRSPAILHLPEEVRAYALELGVALGRPLEPGFATFVARLEADSVDEREWTYIDKNGCQFPVMLSITSVRDDAARLTGYLGIAYDLTERKKIEQMKTDFVSTVSHELRTPLTSIRGSLGLLVGGAGGELGERAASLLTLAYNNCERLVRLINDILDIEKIESGNMSFNMQAISMGELVRQAVAATDAFADEHQVQLTVDIEREDAIVCCDADKITQVVVNLLSNAAKFSPQGATVHVTLDCQPSLVRLVVRDSGAGIPAQFRSRIFQKFAQADSSDTRQKGGTGLGLSISKAIVEQHHGQIGFVDTGKGCEFFVELPLDLPSNT
jgi:PAS domain S-box-containing protein